MWACITCQGQVTFLGVAWKPRLFRDAADILLGFGIACIGTLIGTVFTWLLLGARLGPDGWKVCLCHIIGLLIRYMRIKYLKYIFGTGIPSIKAVH